jgi:hypothetical protein
MPDNVKIYNRTPGVVKLARTKKREVVVESRRSIVLLWNDVEKDPRLLESIKSEIQRGSISTTMDNLLFSPSLKSEEISEITHTERVLFGPSFPDNPLLGQIWLRTDLNALYWWDGTTWLPIGAGSTDELVKVSSVDTLADYLNSKLVAGTNIVLTIVNPGGNEQIEISATPSASASCDNILVCYDGNILVDYCGNVVCACG